jgi:hypothetical protein
MFQGHCIMTFSEQPNEPKQSEQDREHADRFFLLSDWKVNMV